SRAFAAAEIAATETSRLLPALDVLYAGRGVASKAEALTQLIPRLGDEAAATAIRTLRRLGDWWAESRLLLTLAPQLGPPAAEAAFDHTSMVTSCVIRARVTAALVSRVPDSLRDRVVAVLDGIMVDYAWVELLVAMVERWPSVLTNAAASLATARIGALWRD